jgi:hypothetical protein
MMMAAFATASAGTVLTGQASGRVVVILINGGERVTVHSRHGEALLICGYHQRTA